MLLECRNLADYMDLVLLDERDTLVDDNVYHFFLEYFPKVTERQFDMIFFVSYNILYDYRSRVVKWSNRSAV